MTRRWFRSPWLWAFLAIVVIEARFHAVLPARHFNHEVDHALYAIDRMQATAPVLLIGDSVGKGIFEHLALPAEDYTTLACNQAIETAGQYFLVRRYIAANAKPRAVVFCAIDPRAGDLVQPLTGNYVQRCFTRWGEIGDLLLSKQNPVFSAKMVAYRLFASLKYRTHLQYSLIGLSDRDRQVTASPPAHPGKALPRGLFDVTSRALRRRRGERQSLLYLRRLAAYLDHEDIAFYHLPAPSPPDGADRARRILAKLAPLAAVYPRFGIRADCYRSYPQDRFADACHLNRSGLQQHAHIVRPALEHILADTRRESPDAL